MLVAVYGTLKEGYCNHQTYLPARKPAWRGFLQVPFAMFSNGEYPMLAPSDETHPILVEVFDVEDEILRELDSLEEPFGYSRVSVVVPELKQAVEIYVHPEPPPPEFRPLLSGDWIESDASIERFRS